MLPMNSDAQPSADREIVLQRVLDAPRELVFSMFTDPVHLARWWGPRGYTNPVCELDLRPGGTWRNVMRSADGAEFPSTFEYREIVAPERIVYYNAAQTGVAPPSLVTITFQEQDGKTLLTVSSLFSSTADRDKVRDLGFAEGMTQSFERLEAVLAAARRAV